jgi:hypothetical protein
MQSTLDRNTLDIRCSKHMYTVWDGDHANERRMDWVYRNIPGARITRRTHQVIEVPVQPEQEVFQTLLPFAVDERPGGFGDRNPGKEERYLRWMEADLLDFPDDPRALYYLGYGNLDLFHAQGGNNHTTLDLSIHYFGRRVNLPEGVGNKEERWFATLKLAEIHERFKQDWPQAEKYYLRCNDQDGVRADAWFYLGQHYRLRSDPHTAEPYLHKAATLAMPSRSLFMWHHLYTCLSKLEYGRNWALFTDPTLKVSKRAVSVLLSADCRSDPSSANEVRPLLKRAQDAVERKRAQIRKSREEKRRKAEEPKEPERVEEEKPKQKGKGKKKPPAPAAEEEEEALPPAKKKAKGKKPRSSQEVDEPRKAEKDKKQRPVAAEEEEASPKKTKSKASSDAPPSEADLHRCGLKTSFRASDAEEHARRFAANSVPTKSEQPSLADVVSKDETVPLVRQLMRLTIARADDLDATGVQPRLEHARETKQEEDKLAAEFAVGVYARILTATKALSAFMDGFVALPKGVGEAAVKKKAAYLTCQRYRRATSDLVSIFHADHDLIDSLLEDEKKMEEWKTLVEAARKLCR